MTETVETKLYESLLQPNHDKPITIDTFSYWSIPVARIKIFNGVENSLEIMAVYSHLLGWKKTTGQIRPAQQYIADCCCMGLSTVQKKVKLLVKMGWITATSVRKPGSKEISHTVYTVKDPEVILAELNAGLSQQGSAVVTIAKKQKPKAEEKGKNGQKTDIQEPAVVERAAPVIEQTGSLPAVAVPVDADLSSGDDAPLSESAGENVVGIPWLNTPFEGFQLRPEARRWAQLQGATTWQDEIKLVWKLTGKTNMGEPGEHMRPDDVPAPEPAKQQANGYAPQLDYDEDQPF
ncbi:hypothetical protein OVA10_20145 [Lelliottia sp. SL45]|uniref:hypothetical protein n=1 Tax=Lelliottia sp. SL45 TaxID=2994665 RepID=UPI00227528E4|nr:hypothetical protein [Lelliottia sp. SL45]MCY1700351.1 hypothetical protein [Lelliottia sp. SL45]